MAELLKQVWEPVWKGGTKDDWFLDCYLRSYEKRLRRDVGPVELADVAKVIGTPKKTCSGPNGIPFAAYAAVCSLAAPVFFEAIQALCMGRSPTKGYGDFNMAEIYFLPKDETMDPSRLRPIAASNTCNRIIANVVRAKIEGPLLEILSKAQTGFVPGRSIEEHIRQVNERLTRAMSADRPYHLLLLELRITMEMY